MNNQLYCPDEARKALVSKEGTLNGIDYLEVLDNEAPPGSPRQQTLLVHCLLPVAGLTKSNVVMAGGVRVRHVGVTWAYPANNVAPGLLNPAEQAYLGNLPEPPRVLVVRTDTTGDFSTYTLRLALSPSSPQDPPPGFDPLLAAVDFSFKVDCPSQFDCNTKQPCPEPAAPTPQIDYLAKDYASFRRLMLDRLALLMPDWRERNPADAQVALVELLAYVADHLSYYQDAVATEAYLGTARKRVSARRHARLVDYLLHDGSNARAWVCMTVDQDLVGSEHTPLLPPHTPLLTGKAEDAASLHPDRFQQALSEAPTVFETLHPVNILKVSRNQIPFYTWRDPDCCLPKGSTRATLLGAAADLELREGDVLIFEEALGPDTGRPQDADPAHRHAVRLSSPPQQRTDPSNGVTVLEISWHQQDALPFPLRLRQFDDGAGNIKRSAVARGNVVLADHGLTFANESPLPESAPTSRPYRPSLRRRGLTHATPYLDAEARKQPAQAALKLDLRQVLPQVALKGEFQEWKPQRDLTNSDRFAPEFVVETEEDGAALLRFGDGLSGRRPAAGAAFTATYRVGNGPAGNVGAGTLKRMVTDLPGINQVWNPMSAAGGMDPEPLERVRLNAPQAFRTQERAVIAADYAAAAQRHPEVQRAAATRRWTGSWHTMFVTVDRRGGGPVAPDLQTELGAFLDRFRLAGYDVHIDAPSFVPLDIALMVCLQPGHIRGHVRRVLLETFSNADLPNGQRGFFHPDSFTFGQPVYLSQAVAACMKVPGVAWVKPLRFQRWGHDPHGELQDGRIALARLEIARLDNDPNAPENGRLDLELLGGL